MRHPFACKARRAKNETPRCAGHPTPTPPAGEITEKARPEFRYGEETLARAPVAYAQASQGRKLTRRRISRGGAVGGTAPEDALATGRGGGSPTATGPAGWIRPGVRSSRGRAR